jgi:hypothetical protein
MKTDDVLYRHTGNIIHRVVEGIQNTRYKMFYFTSCVKEYSIIPVGLLCCDVINSREVISHPEEHIHISHRPASIAQTYPLSIMQLDGLE